jgi:hypothetical protein
MLDDLLEALMNKLDSIHSCLSTISDCSIEIKNQVRRREKRIKTTQDMVDYVRDKENDSDLINDQIQKLSKATDLDFEKRTLEFEKRKDAIDKAWDKSLEEMEKLSKGNLNPIDPHYPRQEMEAFSKTKEFPDFGKKVELNEGPFIFVGKELTTAELPYKVFIGDEYYPIGGYEDFVEAFQTFEHAKHYLNRRFPKMQDLVSEWAHIVFEDKIIYDHDKDLKKREIE